MIKKGDCAGREIGLSLFRTKSKQEYLRPFSSMKLSSVTCRCSSMSHVVMRKACRKATGEGSKGGKAKGKFSAS